MRISYKFKYHKLFFSKNSSVLDIVFANSVCISIKYVIFINSESKSKSLILIINKLFCLTPVDNKKLVITHILYSVKVHCFKLTFAIYFFIHYKFSFIIRSKLECKYFCIRIIIRRMK